MERAVCFAFFWPGKVYKECYHISFATNLISGPTANAFETGQPFFAASACVCRSVSVRPGTSTAELSSINEMVGPSVRCTVAMVEMRVGVVWVSRRREASSNNRHVPR